MSAVRRRVFSVAALMSLLLCVATVVLWFVSHRWPDRPPSAIQTAPAGTTVPDVGVFLDSGSIGYRRLTWYVGAWEASAEGPSFEMPIWVLTAFFGVPALVRFFPAERVYHRIRRRISRHRPGICPTCSYDLTGNASGVCPECGTPTWKVGEAKA